jgi:hypothetical protein
MVLKATRQDATRSDLLLQLAECFGPLPGAADPQLPGLDQVNSGIVLLVMLLAVTAISIGD